MFFAFKPHTQKQKQISLNKIYVTVKGLGGNE